MQIEELYRLYFNDIYRYLLKLSGNETVAEDLTCEVFFKAIKASEQYRGECDIRVWLCRIARNCWFSYLKKNRRTDSLEERPDIEDASLPLKDSVLDRLEAGRAKGILHSLPEIHKEVFMWSVYADLGFEEIGALFGKTANWACVTYYRARKMIQKEMEKRQTAAIS